MMILNEMRRINNDANKEDANGGTSKWYDWEMMVQSHSVTHSFLCTCFTQIVFVLFFFQYKN